MCHSFNKYFHRADDEVEDEVDSDFSIDENDEPVSDHEEEGPKRSRGAINTKAYKVLKFQRLKLKYRFTKISILCRNQQSRKKK